jgi:hypothetical protein
MTKPRWVSGWNVLTLILCMATVWVVGNVVRDQAPSEAQAAPTKTGGSRSLQGVNEIAIFIGTHRCGVCSRKDLPQLVRDKIDSLRTVAVSRGSRFTVVGVAMDLPRKDALRWIDRFGPFDQVSVGGNWMNEQVVRSVWQDEATVPAVPQLLLVRRTVAGSDSRLAVTADTVLDRWLGLAGFKGALADTASSGN